MKFFSLLILLQIVYVHSNSDDVVHAWMGIDKAVRSFSVQMAQQLSKLDKIVIFANLSPACLESLVQLQQGLNQSKDWAFKMLDANGKIPAGFLNMNGVALGDYYECVNLDVKDAFQGKYCLINVRLPLPKQELLVPSFKEIPELQNITDPDSVIGSGLKYIRIHYLGPILTSVCMPSICTKTDLQKITSKIIEILKVKVNATVTKCKTKSDKTSIDAFDLFSMTVLATLISTVFIATLLDVYHRSMFEDNENREKGRENVTKYLLYFSFVTNAEKLFRKDENSDSFGIFHGIRTIAACWSVLNHTFLVRHPHVIDSAVLNKDLVKNPFLQFAYNATLITDTFCFLSAVILAYSIAKHKDKNISIVLLIAKRYMRTAMPLFLLILCVSLLHLLNSGPIFEETVGPTVKNCKENGWANMLYITNYFKPMEIVRLNLKFNKQN